MDGHLFIFRGDLTQLACDAWLMPTDDELFVESYWLQPEPDGFRESLNSLRGSLSPDWLNGDVKAMPVDVWDAERSPPWLVNISGTEISRLDGIVRSFVQAVMDEGASPRNGRERLLIALPVLSTGKGSGAKFKGQVVAALVGYLLKIIQETGVDIALVTHTAAAFAAAQQARKDGPFAWDGLTPERLVKARGLADISRRQGLALFLGAGVSCSAGLPSWNGLLKRLAKEIQIEGRELEEFSNLDVLDRGSILQRRFSARGDNLQVMIASMFSQVKDHSLLHGMLACLPSSEVITQNYDQLFEKAAAGAGRPVATLPYTHEQSHNRWLLKMHGCVSNPQDIVIRREDYLRYAERRAALTGIVQATLLTRGMLFVGFSLRDGNFHRAVDDVRRAVLGTKDGKSLGTALFLAPSPLTAELWSSELEIVHFQDPNDPAVGSEPAAARRLEIFTDCLLAHCKTTTNHLLDPTFAHLLSDGEKELKLALERLGAEASSEARGVPAWNKVQELLTSLGWPPVAG